MYFQESQLMSEDPTANPDWMTKIAGFLSGRSVKEVEGESAYIVANSTNDDNDTASFIKIDNTGETSWSKTYPAHGEITDIALSYYNGRVDGYFLGGHVNSKTGALDGIITNFLRTFQLFGLNNMEARSLAKEFFPALVKKMTVSFLMNAGGSIQRAMVVLSWHVALANIVTNLKITNGSLRNVLLIQGKSGEAC